MQPKVSIVVPFHWMQNWQFFLTRCLESIEKQSFKNYEVILTKAGSMPVNTNRAMNSAKGEWIKVLYMDDYFAHENSLQDIVNTFNPLTLWIITGADTNPTPYMTLDIKRGNNKLGSPSALTIRSDLILEGFDERMSWLLDCDYYWRLYESFGPPKILVGTNVIIGQGPHQMTHILTDEEKRKEHDLIKQKYA